MEGMGLDPEEAGRVDRHDVVLLHKSIPPGEPWYWPARTRIRHLGTSNGRVLIPEEETEYYLLRYWIQLLEITYQDMALELLELYADYPRLAGHQDRIFGLRFTGFESNSSVSSMSPCEHSSGRISQLCRYA
jgi:hypothetical protein